MLMDVVYPYRSAPDDFELRYSLRSLTNLPHRNAIVAGDRPGFASEALTCIEVEPVEDRYKSSTANILAAAEHGGLTDDFIVMHDDIFILEPWQFRHEHHSRMKDYLARGGAAGDYRERVKDTLSILTAHGIADPLWYGLHTPTIYNRDRLIELTREFDGQRYLLRSLYHNLFPAESHQVRDVKARVWPPTDGRDQGAVLSISDTVAMDFRFREWIEARFPDRCRYEHHAEGLCLILGYSPEVWSEAYAVGDDFEAVIASPEAAKHRYAQGWDWGDIDAIGRTDDHCLRLASHMGFDPDQIVFCGRQKQQEAA